MTEWLLQIFLASIGATISGIILLLIHHSKVKQELELHRQKEIFDKKQRVYRIILNNVNQLRDYSLYLGSDMNWKLARLAYDELILIGSEKVIIAYHKFQKEFKKIDSDDKVVKKLYNAIREDLYETSLPEKEIKMVGPGTKTTNILKILGDHYSKLRPLGLENLHDLSNMDVEEIHSKTSISKDDLKKIKVMAEKENQFDEEIKKFVDP